MLTAGTLFAQDHAFVFAVRDSTPLPVHCVTALAGGGVLTAGLSYADTSYRLLKVDTAGHEVWCIKLQGPCISTHRVPEVLREYADGTIGILTQPAPISDSTLRSFELMKLDSEGTPLWAKRYTFTDQTLGGIMGALSHPLPDGSTLLYFNLPDAYVTARADASGTIEWARVYHQGNLSGMLPEHLTAAHMDDEGILTVQRVWNGLGDDVGITYLDVNGAVQWAVVDSFGVGPILCSVARMSDGSFLLGGRAYDLGYQHPTVLKIDSLGQVIWRRNYWNPELLLGYVEQITCLPNGGFVLFTGSPINDNIIHCVADGSAISCLRNHDDSLAFTGGFIVQANDQRFRLTGSAWYGIPGWGYWGRVLDLVVPFETDVECSRSLVTILSETTTVDSVSPVLVAIATPQITVEDQFISSAPLLVYAADLCEFANGFTPYAQPSAIEIKVCPTPSEGMCTLHISGFSNLRSTVDVDVFDSHGRLVAGPYQVLSDADLPLDLRDHGPGLYHIRVSTRQQSFTTRTIVE